MPTVLLTFLSTNSFAAKLAVTKAMMTQCASLKGDKAKFQACLIKAGAKIADDSGKSAAPSKSKTTKKPDQQKRKAQKKSEEISQSSSAIYVEDRTFTMFSGGDDGACSHEENVTIFCTDYLCVIWQKSNKYPVPSKQKMAKVLNLLEKYIDFGSRVMNYRANLKSLQDKVITGKDGKSRKWTIELADSYCGGYGGASYNGRSWNALPKEHLMELINSIDDKRPIMPQVVLYEMGRSMYDLALDNILDWQMDDATRYGYWTLGFNGALTVLAPEALNLRMSYQGTENDLALFRKERLADINKYISNKQWNFDNAWTVWLLPWEQGQSINDMMTGLILLLTDKFGGIAFLSELVKQLQKQPPTPNKTDRKARAKNFYVAAKNAATKITGSSTDLEKFFKQTLRWTFLP